MIELKNVSKFYGKHKALDNVSISLKYGQIVGLLGPNGSGKTTLIKILNGLLRDYQGEVLIDNQPIGVHSKEIISYLPDQTYLADWMNGKKAIALFKTMYKDFDEQRMYDLLLKLKLDPAQTIKTMSKGMKERFQLALVMSRRAKIYILDEPIGGVDPAARELILNTILDNYATDSLVIISTHIISEIEQIFDTVIFLKEGQVVTCDDVDVIRTTSGKTIDELFKEVFKC
ncbi:SkfA peptide export ATP-binding protein SkfE [bioreactor metagenome]|uniref:SkfA peptide export ATP-binding protein SkfE n=1 Tax=bioreactor metagenome TaxID=1076179 RepID=A0A644Z5P8_9ZZZZ|nr:ABC transporter ATP-binding protein [Erysipelotrichaceae bacterium]